MSQEDSRIGEIPFMTGRVLSAEERLQLHQFLELEQEFLSCIDRLAKQKGGHTRGLALAKTNMQQARMWAVEEILKE